MKFLAADRALTEQSLAICRTIASPLHPGRALNLADILVEQGELDRTDVMLEESVRLQR